MEGEGRRRALLRFVSYLNFVYAARVAGGRAALSAFAGAKAN